MNNSVAALAVATLAANANKSASAGVLGESATLCNQSLELKTSPPNFCLPVTPSPVLECAKISHQIGTNLADLSVCWHKMENVEACKKCGRPFYNANQFECDVCCAASSSTTTTTMSTKDEEEFDAATLSTTASSSDEAEQTRKSFQEEFSSLIIKSDNFKSFILPLEQSNSSDTNASISSGYKTFPEK